MTPQTINIITNVIAVLLALLEPLHAYFASQPFSWPTFITCILTAVVGYFTAKSTLSQTKQ